MLSLLLSIGTFLKTNMNTTLMAPVVTVGHVCTSSQDIRNKWQISTSSLILLLLSLAWLFASICGSNLIKKHNTKKSFKQTELFLQDVCSIVLCGTCKILKKKNNKKNKQPMN